MGAFTKQILQVPEFLFVDKKIIFNYLLVLVLVIDPALRKITGKFLLDVLEANATLQGDFLINVGIFVAGVK